MARYLKSYFYGLKYRLIAAKIDKLIENIIKYRRKKYIVKLQN